MIIQLLLYVYVFWQVESGGIAISRNGLWFKTFFGSTF